jgi:hypothetical protein
MRERMVGGGGSVMRTDNQQVGELYVIQCFCLRRGKGNMEGGEVVG